MAPAHRPICDATSRRSQGCWTFRNEKPRTKKFSNLAQLLQATNRLFEAEPLMRRALAIDEECFGANHPNVAIRLNNLALWLHATDQPTEAELLMRRALAITLNFERQTGFEHPRRQLRSDNYRSLLQEMGKSDAEIEAAFATLEIQPPS